jgi:DNA processing protein
MLEDKIALLALIRTPGVGSVTIRQLISYCGGAANVYSAEFRKLIKVPGVGEKVARAIMSKEGWKEAEKELETCASSNVDIIVYTDPRYPKRLKNLYDSPVVLYTKGSIDYNHNRTVGIVGTRQVTDYGKAITETIVHELAPFSPLLISGLAYGVDITAHRACLKHQVPTLGVMASGVDVIYPSAHRRTALDMQANGGIVTENPLGTKPDFMRFPARNRIIAGLSDVTIVVESARKGGSLITVEYAQNYHRDVYAVPGNLGNPMSEGCNQLIRSHKASIFTNVEDMAKDLQWTMGLSGSGLASKQGALPAEISFEGFTQNEGQVLALLKKNGAMQLDELSWQSGLQLTQLASLLLNLEFQGMVRSLPGKKYALI